MEKRVGTRDLERDHLQDREKARETTEHGTGKWRRSRATTRKMGLESLRWRKKRTEEEREERRWNNGRRKQKNDIVEKEMMR